jgi:hypothetical protein
MGTTLESNSRTCFPNGTGNVNTAGILLPASHCLLEEEDSIETSSPGHIDSDRFMHDCCVLLDIASALWGFLARGDSPLPLHVSTEMQMRMTPTRSTMGSSVVDLPSGFIAGLPKRGTQGGVSTSR